MRKSNITKEKQEVAARLRDIRINAGLTQEKLAEILEISLSAYKKIESGENQISIDCLRILEKQLHVSSDYVLFGKQDSVNAAWKMIVNCPEEDKIILFLRLFRYFTVAKERKYSIQDVQSMDSSDILRILKEIDV